MSSSRWTLSTIAWFLLVSAASAQESSAPDALFLSDDILEVALTAPIATLLDERSNEEELPGTFRYTDSAGEVQELEVNIRTRGRFRRDKSNCRFPPIRLNFKKSQTDGTLFENQDKVKLVTHCQSTKKYEQTLLSEYIAYRMFNVVTDISFRVRLLKITYVDSDGKRSDEESHAIIIEHKDRLAKRVNKSVLDVPKISPRALDPAYTNLAAMFHYLIGNTDFSPVRAAEGETCCHNHVLLRNEGEATWSVPYDFDQAGLVDAPHAGPAPQFRIRSVTQRLYRGRCINNEYVSESVAIVNSKQEEIMAVLDEVDAIGKRERAKMTNFVERFFKILGSEKRIQKDLIDECI